MAASRVQDQSVARRHIEPDVVFPDREGSPAYEDQFIVVEHTVGMAAVTAADEQAARTHLDAQRGLLDSHLVYGSELSR